MNRALRLEILKNFDTQSDFAQAVRTHDTKVSQVLHGRRKLSKKHANTWVRVLRCNPKLLAPVTKGPSQ